MPGLHRIDAAGVHEAQQCSIVEDSVRTARGHGPERDARKVSVGVHARPSRTVAIDRENRVARKRVRAGEVPELARPLSSPADRTRVPALRIEHAQLIRSAIGNNDRAVREAERRPNEAQLVDIVAVGDADVDHGLRLDAPTAILRPSRAPAFDDRNARAVPDRDCGSIIDRAASCTPADGECRD